MDIASRQRNSELYIRKGDVDKRTKIIEALRRAIKYEKTIR